jgi:RimJ/RimL family protein N-acetyltransferase
VIAAAPILIGQRVTLRPYSAGFTDDELQRLYRWAQNPEVLALSGGAVVDMPFQQFREMFVAQLPRHNSEREQLFLILDEGGRAIGRVGLFGLGSRFRPRTAELGIVIGERDTWGHGYGRDAVRAVVGFGFDGLYLERITLFTYPDNLRARRAFEAAGFRVTRELRRFSFELGSHTELEMEIRPGPGRPLIP